MAAQRGSVGSFVHSAGFISFLLRNSGPLGPYRMTVKDVASARSSPGVVGAIGVFGSTDGVGLTDGIGLTDGFGAIGCFGAVGCTVRIGYE